MNFEKTSLILISILLLASHVYSLQCENFNNEDYVDQCKATMSVCENYEGDEKNRCEASFNEEERRQLFLQGLASSTNGSLIDFTRQYNKELDLDLREQPEAEPFIDVENELVKPIPLYIRETSKHLVFTQQKEYAPQEGEVWSLQGLDYFSGGKDPSSSSSCRDVYELSSTQDVLALYVDGEKVVEKTQEEDAVREFLKRNEHLSYNNSHIRQSKEQVELKTEYSAAATYNVDEKETQCTARDGEGNCIENSCVTVDKETQSFTARDSSSKTFKIENTNDYRNSVNVQSIGEKAIIKMAFNGWSEVTVNFGNAEYTQSALEKTLSFLEYRDKQMLTVSGREESFFKESALNASIKHKEADAEGDVRNETVYLNLEEPPETCTVTAEGLYGEKQSFGCSLNNTRPTNLSVTLPTITDRKDGRINFSATLRSNGIPIAGEEILVSTGDYNETFTTDIEGAVNDSIPHQDTGLVKVEYWPEPEADLAHESKLKFTWLIDTQYINGILGILLAAAMVKAAVWGTKRENLERYF